MPLFEMPLHELKEYRGTNPKPDDFDEYWSRAIEEMRSIDPKIEIEASDFQAPFAECFDLTFTGVRDARIHALYLRPTHADTPHPAVLQFHGYSGNAGDWTDKLPYVSAGFSVFALDCRGQGGSSEDSGGVRGNTFKGHIVRGLDDDPENLLFRHVFLDTAQLASIAMSMDEVDENRVAAMGGSQGGGLTVACSALEPRITCLAPTFPFLSDYRRVWGMDLAKNAYQELTDYFRLFDPRHERENEIFKTLGYIDIQHLANRIRGTVFWAIAMMDQVCPPSSQFATYNKLSTEKDMVMYPDYGHERLPGFADSTFRFILDRT